ncbi:Dihydroorotase [hydrothermal vent metagenome]|uniref:Dihydroorotase n=1 Tax=hydrothermal vent metagenome TaxID=652676 RepID=A0A3B0RFD6_9ZZZZ
MMARTPEPTLIQNARIVDAANGLDEIGDVLIQDGVIADIGQGLDKPETGQIIDASDLVLSPGLIDLKVKTGEPGSEHRETLASAGLAAAAGGVTTMVIAPDTDPVIDDAALVEFIARSSRQKSLVNVLPAGALTKGLRGEQMAEIGLMSQAGAVLFSNGDLSVANADVMRKVMAYAGAFNALVSCRAEDANLAGSGVMHAGELASRLGLKGIPTAAETICIARDIALAELTGGRLLIEQISSAPGIALVREAKAKGLDVSCTVSVHHLCLNELDVGEYRSFARLSPPLRAESDRLGLVAGVKDGTVDAIVSGHDPRPAEEKRLPFAESSAGACGLETLLGGALSLVHTEALELSCLLAALTSGPADLLDLACGKIVKGAPADLVLFDLERPWVCDADQLLSKSKNTPFDGRRMQGQTQMTWVAGQLVFDRDAQNE